jgi:hypothetical protein
MLMKRNRLTCGQCGVSVRLAGIASPWQLVPLLVAAIVLGSMSMPVWAQLAIGVLALVAYLVLAARSIVSAHLVLQDRSSEQE